MSVPPRTSSDPLLPIAVMRMLRAGARWFRWLKRKTLSRLAFRDISDEVLFSEFTVDEQYGQETLLADTVRMAAYRDGIRRHVQAGDVVVDLGTGTGILAMLAAQQNPKVVHALDLSNIVTLAERIARANHFTNIRFHHVSSRRFVSSDPVDVIVHEQIGQALVDEGLIEKTLDLKRRLLKKSGQILPGRFELFLEPACVKADHRVPYLWENQFEGIDFGSTRESTANDPCQLSGGDWQVGAPGAVDYFVCEPSPILAFDLNEITEPDEVPRTASASKIVRRSGRVDVFCLYFRVVFDADVQFDTSPFSPRTHWDSLHFRIEALDCHQGGTIAYCLTMKDRFDFKTWTVEVATHPPG